MIGTKQSGEKSTEKRGHESLSEAGKKGGHAASGHKAMDTRAEREGKSTGNVASEMGRKGGEHSHGGKK